MCIDRPDQRCGHRVEAVSASRRPELRSVNGDGERRMNRRDIKIKSTGLEVYLN